MLAASTRRDYRVSAINSIGTGTPSDDAFATTGTAANNAPVVDQPDPGPDGDGGRGVQLPIPGEHVQRYVDTGDTLTYTATKGDGADLPTWLTFTPATRTFAGTPAATDVSVAVKVTATDTSSATVSDDFNIEVRAANDPALQPVGPLRDLLRHPDGGVQHLGHGLRIRNRQLRVIVSRQVHLQWRYPQNWRLEL